MGKTRPKTTNIHYIYSQLRTHRQEVTRRNWTVKIKRSVQRDYYNHPCCDCFPILMGQLTTVDLGLQRRFPDNKSVLQRSSDMLDSQLWTAATGLDEPFDETEYYVVRDLLRSWLRRMLATAGLYVLLPRDPLRPRLRRTADTYIPDELPPWHLLRSQSDGLPRL